MKVLLFVHRALWFLYGLIIFPVFLSVADQPLARQGHLPLNATSAALLCLLPFPFMFFLSAIVGGKRPDFLSLFVYNKVVLGAFLLLVFFSIGLSILPGAFWEEGGKWILLITYGFILASLAQFTALNRTIRCAMPVYAFVALILLLGSLWYDMMTPGLFSELNNRAAGFPGNANFAALVAVELCAASLTYERGTSLTRNIAFLVATGLMVIGTMSRSGILNYALLLSFFLYFRFFRDGVAVRDAVKFLVTISAAIFACCAVGAAHGTSLAIFSNENRISRFFNNEQVDDGSAASRLEAAKDSLRLIDLSPILGHGTGYARTMQELPHNLYLQQWVNNGIGGVVSYLLLLVAAFVTFTARRYRPGQAFVAVTALGSVFSHNILDQRPFLLLFGFLLGCSALHSSSQTQDIKKSALTVAKVFKTPCK